MTGLTGIFKTVEPPAEESDKLVDLFRNRAELKKEFATLRSEKFRLEDRIKEQRGAIERVEQKLKHLESLLLDPEWVHNVVTFYQLRRLSAHCESRLASFAEQLKRQREKRIYGATLAAWKEKLEGDRKQIADALAEHRTSQQALEGQLESERRKLTSMGGLSKLVHGKEQSARVDNLEAALAEAREKEARLVAELDRIEKTEPPPQAGLDVAAKRSINFMILSFLQQLYLDYWEDNLAASAKEASEKSVGAVNYGCKRDCDEILERLEQRREEVDRNEPNSEILQQRAKMIAADAVFRGADDPVPTSASVATVFDIMANGAISRIDANLLGENYFKIARVLSR